MNFFEIINYFIQNHIYTSFKLYRGKKGINQQANVPVAAKKQSRASSKQTPRSSRTPSRSPSRSPSRNPSRRTSTVVMIKYQLNPFLKNAFQCNVIYNSKYYCMN
jgi:hypothetical protein